MLINQFNLSMLVFFLIEMICMELISNVKPSTTIGPERMITTARIPNEREKEFLIKLVTAIEQSPGPTFNETSSYNRSFRNTIIVLVTSVVVFVIVATLMIVKCWKNDRKQRAYKRAALGNNDSSSGDAGAAADTTVSNCDNNEEMKTF